jgi:membrane protein YdbS with pleckstrin-like domain
MILKVDEVKLFRLLRYGYLAFLIPRFGRWWPERFVESVEYRLDPHTLFVNQGVFFRAHKAIPVARITDVVLYQGPLLRRAFDTWLLRIQTAGTSHAFGEATLMCLTDPEGARAAILAAARASSSEPRGSAD